MVRGVISLEDIHAAHQSAYSTVAAYYARGLFWTRFASAQKFYVMTRMRGNHLVAEQYDVGTI